MFLKRKDLFFRCICWNIYSCNYRMSSRTWSTSSQFQGRTPALVPIASWCPSCQGKYWLEQHFAYRAETVTSTSIVSVGPPWPSGLSHQPTTGNCPTCTASQSGRTLTSPHGVCNTEGRCGRKKAGHARGPRMHLLIAEERHVREARNREKPFPHKAVGDKPSTGYVGSSSLAMESSRHKAHS